MLSVWPTPTSAEENYSRNSLDQTLLIRELLEPEGLVQLAIHEASLREQDGLIKLDLTLIQQQPQPLTLSIPLLIITPERSFSATLPISQQENQFSLVVPRRPTEIRIDPYQEILRRLGDHEIPPTWAGFLAAEHSLAIIPEDPPANWTPLLDFLAAKGIAIKPLAQFRDRELAAASLLFLSSDQQNPARGFFAEGRHPAGGISLSAYPNPLNREHLAILLRLGCDFPVGAVTPAANVGPSAQSLAKLLELLESPGLFSRLQITHGSVRHQSLAAAEKGLRVMLDPPLDGIAAAARQSLAQIMAGLAASRVIYVGEVHPEYQDHQLQLRVLRSMHQQSLKLAVAMEMFPVSAQPALDAFVAGEIDEATFLRQSDYFNNWGFDYRLYRNIINFARQHQLPIIALNLEREITRQVFRKGGISELSPEQQAQIPLDRDLALPGYYQRIAAALAIHGDHGVENGDRFSGFLQAQSLWDEHMAARMAEFLTANPGHRLLAVVGRGHTDKRNAIPPRLARRMSRSTANNPAADQVFKQTVLLPVREYPVAAESADYFIFLPPQSLPKPARLGIQIRDGAEDAPGALVVALSPHDKADASGIKKNDLIIAIDGYKIRDTTDLRIFLLYRQPGETVRVLVQRLPTESEPKKNCANTKQGQKTELRSAADRHDGSENQAPTLVEIAVTL